MSFVFVDLETTWIAYQDVGRRGTCVHMYDNLKRGEVVNPVVETLICADAEMILLGASYFTTKSNSLRRDYKAYMLNNEGLCAEIVSQKNFCYL